MCLVRRAVRHFGQKGLARGRQTEKLTTEGASTFISHTSPRLIRGRAGNGKHYRSFSQPLDLNFRGLHEKAGCRTSKNSNNSCSRVRWFLRSDKYSDLATRIAK